MNKQPRVTIAIPTYNRAAMLKDSLRSALAQDYPDFRVLVLDNASEDGTREVVAGFADARIEYIRHEANIGLFGNWNSALRLNSDPYLCILQDDDEILPGFLSASINALENNPGAAFSYTHTRFIDIEGALLHRQETGAAKAGCMSGLELLHRVVAGDNWVMHVSSVMMRKTALDATGLFDVAHSRHAIEFNLYYRFAEQFDFVFIPEELARVRLHPGQDHKNSTQGTGPLAMLAERLDAVALLLRSDRAADAVYRGWLAQRLLDLNLMRSEYSAQLIPDLNLDWQARTDILVGEIGQQLPAGAHVVLVDENQWGVEYFVGIQAVPFIERDGCYWGAPESDSAAIDETERLRDNGAEFILFAWPAFWLLDYYSGFRDYLEAHYPCRARNGRMRLYDLRSVASDGKDGA